MGQVAPIILFCYNRPRLTEQTLSALSHNILAEQSELFVFCDGPKPGADESQQNKIAEVRRIVRSKQWCGRVNVIESEFNKGLANSVIDGVTRIVNEFGRIIVLEDDLITSKYFLEYMNTALNKYQMTENIMQVSGHQFAIANYPSSSSGFLPMVTSWGWGTWKRAWEKFDPMCKGYQNLKSNEVLRVKFDLENIYPYSQMLFKQMESTGNIDSWAVRWWWSVFSAHGLTLFPGSTLVQNIGFGVDATHTTTNVQEDDVFDLHARVTKFPESFGIDSALWQQVSTFVGAMFRSEPRKTRASWWRRIIGFLNN